MILDLEKKEILEISGGGEKYAHTFGRAVGYIIGGPIAGIFYSGKDLDWW